MKSRSNQAVIGAFVLAAISLLMAGVLIFGSGKIFADTGKAVIFFEGSVKGLNVGSPVMFRGVKVGSVTDIQIDFDPSDLSVQIPVVVAIDRDKFHGAQMGKQYLDDMIEKGLRAQLQTQSIVTGQLAVFVDFFPQTPVVLRGKDEQYPEIPSILSTGEELQKTVAQLPLEDLVEKTHSAMAGIDRLVNSPALHEAIGSLGTTAQETQEMVRTMKTEIKALGQDSREVAEATTRTLGQAEEFFAMEEGVSGELAQHLKATLRRARDTLAKTEETLEAVRRTASDERSTYQFQNAMQEMAEAARSVNTLVEYLERHPETLLRGKGAIQGE